MILQSTVLDNKLNFTITEYDQENSIVDLKNKLLEIENKNDLSGLLIFASEGINGTICAKKNVIDTGDALEIQNSTFKDVSTEDMFNGVSPLARTNNENEMTMYIKDVNGSFQGSGKIYANGILVGDYVEELTITDNYHTGWWYINVGTSFNSTNLQETKPNLVVQNITLEGDTTNDPAFTNILDTKQSEDIVNNPTRASYYAVLSHQQGATEINLLDSRWVIRTELAHGNSLTVGDKFSAPLQFSLKNAAVYQY